MTRSCYVFLLVMGFLMPDVAAQTRRPVKKASQKKAAVKTPAAAPKPSITVDTLPARPAEVVIAAPIDTVKKDSTLAEQVADVVHDSIKAQLKAPIVQVPIRLKTLLIPGALFTYGCITLNNGSLRGINVQARDWIWNGETFGRPYIEDYLLLVPAAAVYGLNIVGVKGRNNLLDRSVIFGMSNLISNGFVFGLKQVGIETRPDNSDNHSFPSGHTAQAFIAAEFFHQEYKGRVHWTATAGAYAVATSVAYMRMYHNKHWLSDVVAGAGVGMASTRFSYYLYPIIKNFLFGSKKVRESAMIMPTYQPGGGYGLAALYRF